MSNIEDDIKILKDKDCLWIYSEDDILKAQEHILSEREQDKARIKELEEDLYSANKIINEYLDDIPKQREKEMQAKIKELEEKNRMLALEGSRVRLDLYIKENYIPKQKVKDKIELLKEVKSNNIKKDFDTVYKDGYFSGGIDCLEELLEGE